MLRKLFCDVYHNNAYILPAANLNVYNVTFWKDVFFVFACFFVVSI